MAAISGGLHGAGGDHEEDQKIQMFYTSMREFQKYPFNLSPSHAWEKIKLVSDFRQHFDQTKNDILLVLDQNVKGFRRKMIERKIYVEFYDAGLRDSSSSLIPMPAQQQWGDSFTSIWDSKDDTDVYSVSNSKHLEARFGINSAQPTANPRPPKDQPEFQPRADPVCRFIFLAFAPNTRRLKITEELLLKILTYHQVSPYFLNFISYLGHESLSGAGDHFFGGFRSLKFFSEPLSNFNVLDRSGYHYQLAFEFWTIFRPSSQDAEYAGHEAATEITAQKSDNSDLWPLDQCAIYHHFDAENGKSLWMITAAEGEGNKRLSEPDADQGPPFRDVKHARFSTNVLSTSPMDERFRASLSVLLWLANWSLSEYGQYITMLDDDLQKLTRPYIQDMGDGGGLVHETGLKRLNLKMEKLDEIIVALEGNLRVCKAALKFYRDELLQDRKLRARNLPWITDKASRARIREDLDDFQDKMRWVCTSTQEILRRTRIVKQAGVWRKDTVQLLLSNRDVTLNSEVARMTYHSIARVQIYSTITLALLPVSVVSTIFSANIVDFQSGIGGFVGNWSGPAALWWAVMTFLMTVTVVWVSERWLLGAAATVSKTKLSTAASRQESWTTSVRRVIDDLRIFARPYEHRLRVGYARVVGFLRKPTPSPVYIGEPPSPNAWPAEQVQPASSFVVPIRSEPLSPDGRTEGSIADGSEAESAHESAHSNHEALQQVSAQSPEEYGAVESLESEKVQSKGFDQASAAEQGLVRLTVSKERAANGTEG